MLDNHIALPSKPRVILEEENKGVFEIEGLYPGYGHTLGNSIRRIVLSSLPGAAITSLKINNVAHEFSTLDGVMEDILMIILNLKKLRFKMLSDEPQTITISAKGEKEITGKDIKLPGQLELYNPDERIATLTSSSATFEMEAVVEGGLGYVSKEALQKDKVDVGMIAIDATFTPVRRVNYEVENMRVGNRTDYNKLIISIETDGSISPREALEKSIATMIHQLKAVVGFKEEEEIEKVLSTAPAALESEVEVVGGTEAEEDILKTRVEDLNLSVRTMRALAGASIRTVGGLARKSEEDLLSIDGLGAKGITEIKRVLSNFGLTLKQ